MKLRYIVLITLALLLILVAERFSPLFFPYTPSDNDVVDKHGKIVNFDRFNVNEGKWYLHWYYKN